ncbi:MAG: PAS domain S-box protein [Desulfobacterales bacterium]|nr:PAS domain S-box protein [Desulfobacterales bacterium]
MTSVRNGIRNRPRAFSMGEVSRIIGVVMFVGILMQGAALAGGGFRVLYISSYHPGFPTFFQQVEGIRSVFETENILLDIEFMDTKRFPEPESWEMFRRHLKYKLHRSVGYDAVIIADDNALVFTLAHQDQLFRGIPVVFLGVNNIDLALAQNRNPKVTGVVEAVSMADTISLMTRLRPKAKRIVALVDNTPSGQGDLKRFYATAKEFPTLDFSALSLAEMTWDAFSSALGQLDDTAAVLLLSAYRDKAGTRVLFDEGLARILDHLNQPLFHLWAHGIGQGILGGKIISHTEQGRVAAGMTLDILNGTPVEDIRVVNRSPNQYLFDDTVLQHYDIDTKLLPADSLILNRPHSFYRQHRTLIWAVGGVIIVLTICLLLAVVNIYRRRTVEVALRDREVHLRTVIENIPDLVWLKDPEGVYLSCNLKFERFFGASEKEIKGKTDYDFVDRELADFFRENDRAAMAAGRPTMNEEEVVFADDGHHEILETVKTPMHGADGRLIGVLGIARDITERKQAESARTKLEGELRQAHKMEAIGTMSGGIAHDFNNILGIILGNTELAMESGVKETQLRECLDEIKTAGLRAGDIVRQLLNYSRKTEQEKQVLEIRSLVKNTYNLLRSSIPSTIDIHMDLPEEIRPILADATQVHQVLINLCTNATHAMEAEGGVLTIALTEIELDEVTVTQFQKIAAGTYIQLAVSDTGHGISDAARSKIFDPYFTTKDVGKGTGMGLAVVMGIVKNHNGAISVYSEAGRGTTFKVLLPLAKGRASSHPEVPDALPGGNERILFVDDEKALAVIGKSLLESLGYTVDIMTDAPAALEIVQEKPSRFDLIITDMTMPGISGETLTKGVLAVNPHMKLILCTGFSSRIDRERALSIGAHCYMEKPIVKRQLALAVRRTLDGEKTGNRGHG